MLLTNKSDREQIIDILSQSFLTNFSVNFVVKQDHKREKRVKRLMTYSYVKAEKYGKIYLSEDKKACALVLHSSKHKLTPKSLYWDIKLAINCIGIGSIQKVLQREKEIKSKHPKEPFLHLWYIGVHPRNQGKGLGSKLLQEIIKEADSLKQPLYLETSNPKNFQLYERHGFKVTHEIDSLGYLIRVYQK